MSGISNYILNQKINAILGKTSGLPSVINLDTTLTTGNNAGSNDIDMNNNDILQVNNINNFLYFDSVNSRLGINVANPTEDLELDGNFQLDTGGTSKIVFYDKPNNHEHAEIDAEGEGTNGGLIKFQTKVDGGAVSEKLRITENGRIGLGGANYGTSGQVLTSNGTTAPTWTTIPPTPFPSWTTFTATILQPGTGIPTSFNECAYLLNGSMVIARYNIRMNGTGTLGNTIRITLPILTSKYGTTGQVAMNCIGSVAFFDPNVQFGSYYSYSLTANCLGGINASVFFLGGFNTSGLSFFGQFPQVNIVPNTFISATITYEV